MKQPSRLWPIVFAIFTAEIGLFLLIYPWTQAWDTNLLLSRFPQFDDIWYSGYFRGALSGLGLLNLYIAIAETYGMRRYRPAATQAER